MRDSIELFGGSKTSFLQRSPFGTSLFMEVQGNFMAIARLLQYLEGTIRNPGLWTIGNLVESHRLINDLEKMGIEVSDS